MKSILILVLALVLAGCAAATEEKAVETKATDTKADMDALNKVRDDFIAAFNAGDAAKVGDMYVEDAVAMPGDGSPTVQGRAAIIERNKGLFAANSAKITLTPGRTEVSGDLAYDQGTYKMEVTPKAAGGKTVTEEGRYLVVLRREASGWKVIEDIDNSIKPPAPAPAGGKK
jgi:uncharacterized protein (TIGR02246 family)